LVFAMSGKNLKRGAVGFIVSKKIPLLVTLATVFAILFSAPFLNALTISLSSSSASYVPGHTATFTITVGVNNKELLPISSSNVIISGGGSTFTCPLPTGISTKTGVTETCSNGGTVSVNYAPASNFGYGYGYGYANYASTAYYTGYGYGYGYSGSYGFYGSPTAATSFVYTIQWNIGSSATTGAYTATATLVSGSNIFSSSATSFSLAYPAPGTSYGTGGSSTGPGTTTVATTTIAPATTTTILYTTKSLNVTAKAPAVVNVTGTNSTIAVYTLAIGTVGVSVTASNDTAGAPAAPAGLTILSALNITVKTTGNVTENATMPYPCSTPSASVAPYIFKNGTWKAITPFAVDAATCKVTFAVPKDPIVGLLTSYVAPKTTTIVPTTTVAPTTIAPTTTVTPTPTPTSSSTLMIVLVVVVIIVIIAIVAYTRMKPRKGR
jgi:hypothetical protein